MEKINCDMGEETRRIFVTPFRLLFPLSPYKDFLIFSRDIFSPSIELPMTIFILFYSISYLQDDLAHGLTSFKHSVRFVRLNQREHIIDTQFEPPFFDGVQNIS